jgi:hypothetical protein
MNQFRTLLDELKVKELQLHDRRFTWTSGTTNPSQTKINHVFVTKDWELAHPSCYLQALMMWTSTPAIHPQLHIIRFLIRLLGLVHAN